MNINRDNYEEYFLLYIDNELSVAEKNAVDTFVSDNPDLLEELVMLQQSVVKPAAIDFPDKEALKKPETVDDSVQEKLLLLLDNELKGKEKAAMLSLVQYNAAVKQEWKILQQTRCSPADIIEFKEKALLYKKEPRRVVAISPKAVAWWRFAAAAILIGVGLWGTVSYFDDNGKSDPSYVSDGEKVKVDTTITAKRIASPANDITKAVEVNSPVSNSTASTAITSKPIKDDATKPAIENIVEGNQGVLKKGKDDNAGTIVKTPKEDQEAVLESINNDISNEKVIVNVTPETQNNNIKSNIEIPSSVENSIAINTSLKTDAGDNNTFAFEDEEEKPRKTKLGGFFKRVKRVIERKTKIKTGSDDEVRIANMSFAMH